MKKHFPFIINDYYDMLNLHKALLEAKFHGHPDNKNVSGSPIVARIYNDLLVKLTQNELQKKGKESWSEWRKIENQKFYKERAIDNIIHFSEWELMNNDSKIDAISNYFSPFTYTLEELDLLIQEINNKFAFNPNLLKNFIEEK